MGISKSFMDDVLVKYYNALIKLCVCMNIILLYNIIKFDYINAIK